MRARGRGLLRRCCRGFCTRWPRRRRRRRRDAKAAALPKITPEMIDQAAELAGVGPFTGEQKKMMLDGLNDQRDAYAQIRALKMANDVPPAFVFHPAPAAKPRSSGDRCSSKATTPQLVFDKIDCEAGCEHRRARATSKTCVCDDRRARRPACVIARSLRLR